MRQLDRNGFQGYQEPLVEVLLQSLSYHRNLVNLIGYYADSNRLLLLYDCVPWVSLKDRLHGKILNFLSKLRNIRLVRKLYNVSGDAEHVRLRDDAVVVCTCRFGLGAKNAYCLRSGQGAGVST